MHAAATRAVNAAVFVVAAGADALPFRPTARAPARTVPSVAAAVCEQHAHGMHIPAAPAAALLPAYRQQPVTMTVSMRMMRVAALPAAAAKEVAQSLDLGRRWEQRWPAVLANK